MSAAAQPPREGWDVRPATRADLPAVLDLQRTQLRDALEDHGEGFLTVAHTLAQLAALNAPVPHTVAVGDG